MCVYIIMTHNQWSIAVLSSQCKYIHVTIILLGDKATTSIECDNNVIFTNI